MMRPCNKCLENNWNFQKIENQIFATCKNCSNEVQFEAKGNHKRQNPPLTENDLCRKCGGALIKKERGINSNKKPKGRLWYFTRWFTCTKCKTAYIDNTSRVDIIR